MKRLLLTGILLSILCPGLRADPTVYLTTTTITLGSTYYVLVDRSNASQRFGHDRTGTGYDTYVKTLEVMISSNTTEAKVGYVYSINASSANVYWFDRVKRNAVTDVTKTVTRDYTECPLRLSKGINEFKLNFLYDTAVTTAIAFYVYDFSNTVAPAVGDVIVKTTSSNDYGDYAVKIVYDVK